MSISSFGRLLAVIRRVCVSIFVFNDLGQHAVDLVLKPDLELVLHGDVQVVLLAEGLGQRFSSVTLINHNLLDAVLADVDLDVEFGVAVINLLVHVVKLLIDEVFAVGRAFVQELRSHVRVSGLKFIEGLFVNHRLVLLVLVIQLVGLGGRVRVESESMTGIRHVSFSR